jgi:CheY-like chemotaxis protein
LREAAAVIQGTALDARAQTVSLSLPSYPVPIDGDRVRLGQVFANLLENASKYSPDGARIDLALDVEPWDGRAQAVVTVTDRGNGIAEEQLRHVFSLFYQAQPTEARIGSGLGIGLTLVRALIELHGGSVAVRSDGLGQGSEFEVRLPTRPAVELAATHDARETTSKRRRDPRGRRMVLIVEDNADARELLEALCRTWGYAVVTASDGLDGFEKIMELRPFASLVDIGLPGIDGYELARRVRASETGRGLTLVALTGYGLPAQRQRALAAGFNLHLVKPIDPEVLSALLDDPQNTAWLTDRRDEEASHGDPLPAPPPSRPLSS